jgi:hypothetical protein
MRRERSEMKRKKEKKKIGEEEEKNIRQQIGGLLVAWAETRHNEATPCREGQVRHNPKCLSLIGSACGV